MLRCRRSVAERRWVCRAARWTKTIARRRNRHLAGHQAGPLERCRTDSLLVRRHGRTTEPITLHRRDAATHAVVPIGHGQVRELAPPESLTGERTKTSAIDDRGVVNIYGVEPAAPSSIPGVIPIAGAARQPANSATESESNANSPATAEPKEGDIGRRPNRIVEGIGVNGAGPPSPTAAVNEPTAVVIRRPTPGLVGNPRPAVIRFVNPAAVAIGSPIRSLLGNPTLGRSRELRTRRRRDPDPANQCSSDPCGSSS